MTKKSRQLSLIVDAAEATRQRCHLGESDVVIEGRTLVPALARFERLFAEALDAYGSRLLWEDENAKRVLEDLAFHTDLISHALRHSLSNFWNARDPQP